MDYVHPDAWKWAFSVGAPLEVAVEKAGVLPAVEAINKAGAAVLQKLAENVSVKKVVAAAAATMGAATFVNFISEEALQTAGMACFVAKGAGDAVALRKALDNYEALYAEAKKQAAVTTWLSPFTKAQFDANLAAVASAIDAYEAALGAMKKKQAEERAAASLKSKTKAAKTADDKLLAQLDAAIASADWALADSSVRNVKDEKARAKAEAKLAKAQLKALKQTVASALKRADVATAREAAELIEDATERAKQVAKCDDFEAKVAEKAQKARESAARSAIVKANRDAQEQQRALYFASVLGGPDVPEAQKAAIAAQFGLTPPELSEWYRKALAGQVSGSVSGASEMAQGSVYYGRSAKTGRYEYSVATAGGMKTTASASQAAAWAQAAGGKATAKGLAAGH
jgi:hypothetical protein